MESNWPKKNVQGGSEWLFCQREVQSCQNGQKNVQEGSECGFCQREVQTNCQDENNVEFVSKICSNKIDGS